MGYRIRYTAVDDSDALKHWKYIKRERVKGKWVYTYKDDINPFKKLANKVKEDLGFTKKEEVQTAKKNAALALTASKVAKNNLSRLEKRAKDDDGVINKNEAKVIERANTKYEQHVRNAKTKGEEYVKTQAEYLKTPVGKIEATVGKAKEWVKKTFSGPLVKNVSTIEILNTTSNLDGRDKTAKRQDEKKENLTEQKQWKSDTKTTASDREDREQYAKLHDELQHKNPLKKLDLKDEYATREEDLAKINPNFSYDGSNRFNENCSSCAISYELRRRGYDVQARAEDDYDGLAGSAIAELFGHSYEDLAIYKREYEEFVQRGSSTKGVVDGIKASVENYPNGSRGFLNMYWTNGYAHICNWEIVDGKMMIYEAQSNEIRSIDAMDGYIAVGRVMRTDDCDTSKIKKKVTKYTQNRRG